MIPKFPDFKELEFSDKSSIDQITRKFQPYSDFNFISMWSWGSDGGIKISELNNNLVVHFTDYVTNEPFYSFLGDTKINETINQLLELSEKQGYTKSLKLIPEVVVGQINTSNNFLVTEDLGNFDYMYQLDKLRTYEGNKLRSKRNLCTRYKKLYFFDTSVKILNPNDIKEKEEILSLINIWIQNKSMNINENEFKAIHRAMNINEPQDLVFIGLFIKNVLGGFIINEILKDEHVMLHFEKADQNYVGIYSYLMQENAKILYDFGKRVLNYEQDLDLPGLRLAKKAYRPSHYLKKYVISLC